MRKKLLSLVLAASMFFGTAMNVSAVSDLSVTAMSLEDAVQDDITIEVEDDVDATDDSDEEASEGSLIVIDEEEDDDASSALSSDDEDEEEIEISSEAASDETAAGASDLSTDEAASENSKNLDDMILNYHEIDEDPNLESVLDGAEISSSFDAIVNNTYPAKYITPNLPSLRDQNPYGSCWAHSMMAMAEINLAKKKILASPNLSEVHMAYFTYNSVTDPLGGTKGDSNGLPSGSENFMDAGGNIQLAANVVTNWVGAADETVAPYSSAADAIRNGLSSSLAYKDKAHLVNYYMDKISLSNLNPIKELITTYGSIGISYYHSNASGIYNPAKNCYYNKSASSYMSNHAVTVVGWDDNFSKYNFTNTPAGNGAWLVRNSWTTGSEYSLYGYFWMSYYEPSLQSTVLAMEYAKSNNYANNYQYDGSMYPSSIYGSKFANIFTAKSKKSNVESIEAVSFMTPTSNVSYTVKVYKDLKNNSNPESGTLAATVNGSKNYAGYYTIKLPKAVSINNGKKFSVVVSLSKSGYSTALGMEGSVSSWFVTKASIASGQSFVYNGSWTDVATKGSSYGNLRIKAFTNNATPNNPVTVTFDPNGGKTDVTKLTFKTGKYEKLPTPTRKGCTFKGWYTAKKDGKKVAKGGALASKKDHTLYAIWKANKYSIVFNANGGTGKLADMTCAYGKTYALTKNSFKKTGYKFTGWNTKKDGSGKAYANAAKVKNLSAKNGEKITLYAQWKLLSYTVSFNTNGGNKIAAQTVKFNTKTGKYGTATKPANPKRTGYVFVNWYADKEFKTVYNFKNPVKKNITIYAKWKLATHTVTFNSNGGSKVAKQTVKYNAKKKAFNAATKPANPKRTGYKFQGWYTAKTGGTKYDFSKPVTKDITLYAHWKLATHTVTFNSNGGSKVAAQTVKYNTTKKAFNTATKPANPKRTGYKFLGWYTAKTGGKKYTFTTPVSKDITLYAQWKKTATK